MFDACPVHPKGTMVIPMLWRISEYVVCMMGVKNKNHHTHPLRRKGQLLVFHRRIEFLRHKRRPASPVDVHVYYPASGWNRDA